MLAMIRRYGKRILSWSPALYRLGQRAFIAVKLALDRAVFRSRYRSADYVLYRPAQLRASSQAGFRSQFGQDLYLWTSVLDRMTQGFFVDIGANHPIHLSNSYVLELRGWQGVAFDPLSKFEELWRELRTAEFHRAAIAASRGDRSFIEIHSREGWEHTMSAFRDCVREEDMRRYGYSEYDVRTAPLADFVAPGTSIDLIMVDVEGAEAAVLHGLDLDLFRPRYLMVENVGAIGGDESIREFLSNHGYAIIARIGGCDDVFVRTNLLTNR